jgi:hypothetical protein
MSAEYGVRRPPSWGGLPLFASNARRTDPSTSHAAARSLDARGQLGILSRAYAAAGVRGLTDEEAAIATGIESAWKRCSDLRRLGFIVATGGTRRGSSGRDGIVCRWRGDAA